jgi:hypothetical protein
VLLPQSLDDPDVTVTSWGSSQKQQQHCNAQWSNARNLNTATLTPCTTGSQGSQNTVFVSSGVEVGVVGISVLGLFLRVMLIACAVATCRKRAAQWTGSAAGQQHALSQAETICRLAVKRAVRCQAVVCVSLENTCRPVAAHAHPFLRRSGPSRCRRRARHPRAPLPSASCAPHPHAAPRWCHPTLIFSSESNSSKAVQAGKQTGRRADTHCCQASWP